MELYLLATPLGRTLLAACLLTLALPSAFSQSSTGSVRGTVKDQSDAVVPGADVKLVL